MNLNENIYKGYVERIKKFEDLLTKLFNFRSGVYQNVHIMHNFIVELHAEFLIESDSISEEFRKIVKNFEDLKSLGENFELDILVSISLLKLTIEKDDEILKLADCIEGLPCGIFIRYDLINDLKTPQNNGFSAGIYEDKTEAYIGTSYAADTDNFYYLTPGRINIESSNPGIYMELKKEIFNNQPIKYLLNNPNLKWQNFTWTKDCKFPKNAI